MCNSVSLRKSEQEIEDRFDAEMQVPLLFEPYFYQSAFHHENLFIITQEYPEEIVPAIWGLVPAHEALNMAEFIKKHTTINAKSEWVYNSRTYKESIRGRRCLILADGFFSSSKYGDVPYPYFCHLTNDALFAFAGVYTELDDGLFSCAILTQKANDFFTGINNVDKRMPLVIDTEFESEWLRKDLTDEKVKSLMKFGFTKEEFEAYTVSREIYKPKHNRNNPDSLVEVLYPELESRKEQR